MHERSRPRAAEPPSDRSDEAPEVWEWIYGAGETPPRPRRVPIRRRGAADPEDPDPRPDR